MSPRAEQFEIKGGAGEFEAAVIAVVLDRLAEEGRAIYGRSVNTDNQLSAWVRAISPDRFPEESVPKVNDRFGAGSGSGASR